MKLLLGFFLSLASVIASAQAAKLPAHSWKSPGGTLLDPQKGGIATQINGADLGALLIQQFPHLSDLSMLARYAQNLTTDMHSRKTWILDDRAFALECGNQASSANSASPLIVCQNEVEVRISRAWWVSASVDQQASLILREIFTSMALKLEILNQVDAAAALFRAPNFDAKTAREQLVTLGFVFIPLESEIQHVQDLFRANLTNLCSAQNSKEAELKASDIANSLEPRENSDLIALLLRSMFSAIDDHAWMKMCKTSSPDDVAHFVERGWLASIVEPAVE